MSQSVQVSNGTTLKYDSGGGTFVAIAEIMDVQGPKRKTKSIPLTALADTITFNAPGRPDLGEATFTMGFTSANFDLVHAWWLASSSKSFKITDPTTSTEVFTGFITGLERKFQDDEKIVADVTLGTTGAPTWTKLP
jgi:hypothetical protein